MRLLERPRCALLVVVTLTLSAAFGVSETAAHPTEPEHGFNESTYYTLWSGDTDEDANATDQSGGMATLAASTDLPHGSPPKAVELWNSRDHDDFPSTSANTSIYPAGASLTDSDHIEDAYVSIFAAQPSTRARLTPASAPLYVTPNGTVLGTVDYRLAVPDSTDQQSWSIRHHEIRSIRLLVDDESVANTSETHTPQLAYTGLDGAHGEKHELTLEAEIVVSLDKETRHREEECTRYRYLENPFSTGDDRWGYAIDCTTHWEYDVTSVDDRVVVRDSITVTGYDLGVSGYRADYPDGDRGLVVYKNLPWAGYSTPTGDVRGVWAFYSARDPAWDTLVTSTAEGTTSRHSPLHPLQVAAYPIETGPTAHGEMRILDVYGESVQSPTVPEAINLDVLTDEYTASFGIAVREERRSDAWTDVTARGLVRGSRVAVAADDLATVPLRRSNLTLQVVNRTAENVTVRVRLQDASTGEPLATQDREGFVQLDDVQVETNDRGVVTRTFPRSTNAITARYEPGQWWRNIPGYVADSDTVYVRGRHLDLVGAIYGIGVPVGLLLVAAFIVDRLTGWRLWPPWRDL